MDKPSPLTPRESEQEFNRLLQGEGSPERLVIAIKKESRSYVKNVRAGRYRASDINGHSAA